MVVELLIGIALLTVVLYVMMRMVGNVALGAVLIAIVFMGSYLILGSFPDLKKIPIIGPFIPKIPSTTGEAIAIIKDVVYSIEILGVSKSSDGNILVTVANTGQLEVSNFTAQVNGNDVGILNTKSTLKSKEIVTFELDWKDEFEKITIKAAQTEAEFKPPKV